jgi:transcriptional regulator with XRE-family HTH domain
MKKLKKRDKFMNLLKRRGLSQTQFAEKVREAWQEISGRSLSRQAVNAWINGRDVPHFSPAEVLAVLEILGCTLIELAIAFPHEKESTHFEKNLDSLDK